MNAEPQPLNARFSALHIDVARFATDDFNPFHDRNKWQRIEGNPFGGAIALGFQLSSFALHGVSMLHAAAPLQQRYLHVRITFADAVRVDDDVMLAIKPAQLGGDGATVSHRIALRTERSLALTGHIRFVADAPGDLPTPVEPSRLNDIQDRSDVPGTEYFLKRKFMSTANAKNFLLGANVDPAVYFDEFEDRVRFSELFPVSLVSCALLERGTRMATIFCGHPWCIPITTSWSTGMSPCACAATTGSTCWFRLASHRATCPPPVCAGSSACTGVSATPVPVSACSAPRSASCR
jgi:hypothetical protein